jgi:hypothetical protein
MLTDHDRQICIEAAKLVLSEMERIQELLEARAPFKEIFGEGYGSVFEVASKIKYSESGREFNCGRKGLESFRKIASIALGGRVDAEDFEPSELIDRLRDTFLSYAFSDRDWRMSDLIDTWVDTSLSYVRRRHHCYTHYIPCVALQIENEDRYDFGPVTFLRKGLFRDQAIKLLSNAELARNRLSERTRRNAVPGLQGCWERKSNKAPKSPEQRFDELTEGVGWIARIAVPRCAHAISAARTEAALRATLSSLTLLVQGREGANLRLANDPFFPAETNKLSSKGDRNIRVSSFWKFGEPAVKDGWREDVEAQGKPVLAVMHHLIQGILDGSSPSFGFQIARRAITWYADAIRDPNKETCLVKCATAIECLVLPENQQKTPAFVIRGALFAQRQGQPMSHWAPIARRLYKKRGDIVHGNIDSLMAVRNEPCEKEIEFTRNVILQFLVFCRQLQPLGEHRVGTKEDLLELYRACESTFHDDVVKVINEYKLKWKVIA